MKNIRLPTKFEIETLFEELDVDINDVPPHEYFDGINIDETIIPDLEDKNTFAEGCLSGCNSDRKGTPYLKSCPM